MANTAYTHTLRLAFINSVFAGAAFPSVGLYLSLYSTDPSVLVGDRVYLPTKEWTVTSSSYAASAANASKVTFSGLGSTTINGIAVLDSSVGTNYLFAKSITPIAVTSGQAIMFAAGGISFAFNEV